MKRPCQTLVIGASMAVGVSAIASSPAQTGSLTNAVITGSDYIKYNSNGTNTSADPNADLATILTGNSSSPTGNVELFAKSEQSPLFTISTNYSQRVTEA
jgi:hypothetical protein